ncbi:MAG: RsmB/NOP family class I SAM-dependent RNA methyltransferase [Bacteriovoracaceae bacterium]|nr:RsmB/NOP family class I SAM-dependent RNA methyltransferase [Bacteriovoracaceae bacterium]
MGKKKSGSDQFDEFYQEFYQTRWTTLKESLLSPKSHVILKNPYHQGALENVSPFHDLPNLYVGSEELPQPQGEELLPYYFLDGASAFAPLALDIKPGDKVLDLCAAPGGKSLIMAYALRGHGHLSANDKSENRRFRLQKVLRSFLPPEIYKDTIRITGFDASSWCLYELEAYDKILLDAPCSSERHVLDSPTHLLDWRPGRTKRLAANQWTMLASAWLVLRYGGRLVYSTCSLSPLENDGVVSKLLKKFGEEVLISKPEIPGGEPTEWGTILLPDKSGQGPFYLSIMEKVKTLSDKS